jgi:signal transduction histidine kinase
MLLVAVVAVAGFGVPLAVSVQARYRDEALLTLSAEAARAAVAVPGSFARDNDVPELPDPVDDVDVALYDITGQRVLGEGPLVADPSVTAALTGGKAQQNRDDLVVAVPISDEEVVVGAVRTSMPGSVVADRTHRTWTAMAALGLVVLAAAGLLAARRSRSLARPLDQLRADADVIGAGGELPGRSDTGIEEIDAVHTALTQAATACNAALARERSFSSDLAHQLRTPLASLRIRLETEQASANHDIELINDTLRDVDRLERTIDDLLALARDTERAREPRALTTILREVAEAWEPRLQAAGRNLRLDLEPQLPWVEASPPAVRQILDVLINNALVHAAGDIGVSAARLANGAVVAVADKGDTIIDPDEVFVRRHPDASGEGIGLALARRLAEAEDLRLVVANSGPGVTFHLVFGGRRPDSSQGQRS